MMREVLTFNQVITQCYTEDKSFYLTNLKSIVLLKGQLMLA